MVASLYSMSTRVVQQIWQQVRQEGNVLHKKTKNYGRKRIQFDLACFREIPLSKRTCLRILACAMNINKTSLIRLKKDGAIRYHSSIVKPFLKEENKLARLKFYLSMLEIASIPNYPTF